MLLTGDVRDGRAVRATVAVHRPRCADRVPGSVVAVLSNTTPPPPVPRSTGKRPINERGKLPPGTVHEAPISGSVIPPSPPGVKVGPAHLHRRARPRQTQESATFSL